jgi:gas vesicle protein
MYICGDVVSFDTLRHPLSRMKRRQFMADDSKSYGLAWFVAGLGIGALVGILYAPKSGRETREELASSAREGSEYLRAKTRQAAEEVSAFVDKSKEQMTAIVDKSKEQVSEYVDRGRAQWEEFVERGKNLVADQTGRVTAAVEAGRQAYNSTTTE